MKTLFSFVLLTSILSSGTLLAQRQPVLTRCGIYFDHDAVGNRVKRSYDCRMVYISRSNSQTADSTDSTNLNRALRKAPPQTPVVDADPNGPMTASMADLVVYPNPTTGVFTIQLPAMPQTPVHYHWYDAQYRILTSGTLTSQTFKGDISTWADGTYLLQVYWQDRIYGTRIIKISGSR
ncbi:MAG: T9SS type A sorting domain-containing protein [Sphingobacteriales bacterium]|nr:MAG: T9SS type A sorting domain-containing protein [Sphingobacteriales bacterium]